MAFYRLLLQYPLRYTATILRSPSLPTNVLVAFVVPERPHTDGAPPTTVLVVFVSGDLGRSDSNT